MKKHLTNFVAIMLLAACMLPLSASADELTVGNGTASNSYVPFYGLWTDDDQHNQIVYHDSLLTAMEGTNIYALKWYMSSPASNPWGIPVTIKMATTTTTTVSSLQTLPDDAVTVWSGIVDGNTSEMEILFTLPYAYTDGHLLIDITTEGNNYSSASFVGASTPDPVSTYDYGYGGTAQNFLPKTTFGYTDGAICYAPSTLTIDAVDTTSITLSWNNLEVPQGWIVRINGGDWNDAMDSTYTFTDLYPGTYYTMEVASICASGDTSMVQSIGTFTECTPVTFVNEDFESYAIGSSAAFHPCWTRYTTYPYTQYPYVSTASNGSKVMLFYAYGSYHTYLVTPAFRDSLNTYEVEFDAMLPYSSTEYSTYISHMIIGAVTSPDSLTSMDTIAIVDNNSPTVWENKTVSLADYHGEGQHLVFLVPGDGNNSTYNYVYLDNLSIARASTCPKPTRLHAREITSTDAEIVWDANEEINSVMLKWGTVNNENAAIDSVEVSSGNSHALTGLTPGTTYYCWAQALCSDDNSRVVSAQFTTLLSCMPVENLTVENVSYEAATISWDTNDVTGANNFTVSWKADTADTWNTSTVSGTHYLLGGLTTGVSYTVKVAANCSEELASNEVSVSFSTLAYGVIGDNTTTVYMPFYPNYKYSFSEIIWTADELADYGDTINGIYFYHNGINSNRVIDFYMANTDLTTLTSSSYVPASAMTHVYSDTAITLVDGWNYFHFDTPFVRNSARNIIFLGYDHTGSYTYTMFAGSASTVTSLYYYTDSNPINLEAPSTMYSSTNRPVMMLDASLPARGCTAPAIVVTGTTTDEISLAWIPGNNETAWSVDYRQYGDTTWTVAVASVADTFYTIGGLDATTHYEIRVGALCSGETRYSTTTAYTQCGDFVIPYTENFNTMSVGDYVINPCWNLGTAGTSQTPNTVNIAGAGMMMVMPQGSYVIFPQFDSPVNELQVRFQYAVANTDIFMYVGVCEHPEDILSMTVIDTITNVNAGVTEWHTVAFDNYEGEDGYIALYAANLQAYVDDINIEMIPMCMAPDSVMASNITTNSADINWLSAANASGYRVQYGVLGSNEMTTIEGVTGNSVSLSGLQHSTTYVVTVSSACAALSDSSLASPSYRFITECATVDSLPYVMNFDNCSAPALTLTGIMPNCWNYQSIDSSYATSSYVPQIYFDNTYANSGDYSLRMYGTAIVTLPEMPVGADSLMISFHDYSTYVPYYSIIVGVCDSNWGNFAESFVAVDTLVPAESHTNYVIYDLANYTGNGRYIAFKNFYNSTYSYGYSVHYLDDIVVDRLPSCLPVANLHVSGVTDNSVELDWNDRTASSAWEIAYATSPMTDPTTGTIVSVSAHPYTIAGLADSDYYFYVRNVCSDNDKSVWMSANAHPGYYNIPANSADTMRLCGMTIFDDGGANAPYSSSQNTTLVLTADSGYVVLLNGTTYTESTFDYIRIYDGVGTTGTELWNDYGSSAINTISDIISTEGPLTIYFHTDGSVTYDGFEINVQCVRNPCPLSNIAVTDATSSTLPITWTGSSSSYEIEYGVQGFARGSGLTTTSTTNSITLTGLDAVTAYDIYIRGFCEGDTSRWFKATFSTAICDNATDAFSFDTTMTANTSSYSPIGYSFYNYGYVQTLLTAAQLAGVEDDITAFAFNSVDGNQGDYYTNMTVYMANVSENDLSAGWILPDSTHTFVKVIDSADFTYTEGGWHIFSMSQPFTWDGHSNVLVSVKRDHGSYASGASFVAHDDTIVRSLYAYRDSDPFDYTNPDYTAYTSTTVGDIRLISCGEGCVAPVVTSTAATDNSITVNFTADTVVEVAITDGIWDSETTGTEVSGNTYTFTGLTYNTAYTIGLRTICAEGVVSDWTLATVTTEDVPCMEPTALAISDIDYHTATATWTAGGEEANWEVNIFNTNINESYTTTTPTYAFSNLTTGTQYSVSVRALCGSDANIEGPWSDTVVFTTDACQPVTGVTVSNQTATTAQVSWTASSNSSSYRVEYGFRGMSQGEGTSVTVNATSYTITGLQPETEYDVYVQAVCEGGENSVWSDVSSFTTTAASGNIYTISAVPADPTMGSVQGGGSYEENTQVTLTAVPNEGYHFVRWQDGNTDNPRVVTVTGNATYVATFEANAGIEDINGAGYVSLYPNPASSTVTVSVEGNESEVVVSIVDMNGREVKRERTSGSVLTMDISGLSQGAYFVRLTGERVNAIRKLIVK